MSAAQTAAQTALILRLTASLIGLELALCAVLLWRGGRFHWLSAGFWAWAAFVLYFVLAPLAIAQDAGALVRAQLRLAVAGGFERGAWILGVAALGIAAFFAVYMRPADRALAQEQAPAPLRLPLPALAALAGFIAFGLYSLLTFRAALLPGRESVLIVQGRFVGEITGYQNAGYKFLFVPVLLFLSARSRRLRLAGAALAAGFVVLSLPHAWSRFATLSFLIALSLLGVARSGRRFPSPLWLVALLLAAAVYQQRGHAEWRFNQAPQEISRLVQELPSAGLRVLSGSDAAMLPTWYVDSYWRDAWVGYDYGLPAVNYLLTGWMPGRFFPHKYFLVDWLRAQQGRAYPAAIDRLLYGAKSSLLGSFYSDGGLVGVLLGAALAGWLSRRLDAMLRPQTPPLWRSLGFAWLSTLWMVWGSSLTWGVTLLGTLALPALAAGLFLPRAARRLQPREIKGAGSLQPAGQGGAYVH